MSEDKFAFVTEWYDSNASLVRLYHLYFYLVDNSIEIVRQGNNRQTIMINTHSITSF